MKSVPADRWTGLPDNAIIAQINVSSDEIKALGGHLARSYQQLGETELAVFMLDTGKLISLSRTEGNPVPGFTLILAGPEHQGVLNEFLREANLGRDRVTIELRP
jgi:hypothetical protein